MVKIPVAWLANKLRRSVHIRHHMHSFASLVFFFNKLQILKTIDDPKPTQARTKLDPNNCRSIENDEMWS